MIYFIIYHTLNWGSFLDQPKKSKIEFSESPATLFTVLIQNNTNQPESHAQEHIQSKHEEIKQPSRPVLNTPPIHPHFSSDDVSTSFR